MSTLKPLPPVEPVDIVNRYRHIRPRPQQPHFAALIGGVDLTRPLPDEARRELRQALA